LQFTTKKLALVTVTVLIAVIGLALATQFEPTNDTDGTPPPGAPKTVKIALTYIRQTSNYSSLPADLDADVVLRFVDVVEREINDYCRAEGYETSFDFQTYPVLYFRQNFEHPGLPEARQIDADGISLVIGHDTSMLIDGAYDYVHENDMLMVSPDGGTLFIAGDDRFLTLIAPPFSEVEALSALMRSRGYSAFVAFLPSPDTTMRNMTKQLADSLKFDAEESIVLYDPNYKDFKTLAGFASENLVELEAIHGKGRVCIVVAPPFYSEEDGRIFLDALGAYPNLSNTTWFDVAGTPEEHMDVLPGETIARYRFTQVMPWPATGDRLDDFTAKYLEEVGELPAPRRLYQQAARHDAMWMLALSVLRTNSTDASTIRDAMLDVSRGYEGVLGNCTLNAYGSRASSDYALFEWVKHGDSAEFTLVGYYSSRDHEVVQVG
jgi:ABC-type branched-subunit amino acid transport system substrate-binding protein